MHRFLAVLSIVCVVGPALPACVHYRAAPVCVRTEAACFQELRPGPLTFEQAVRLLVEKNAELKTLRAEAAAVNLQPGPNPLVAQTQIMDGEFSETLIGTDVLSLLGVGPRDAERVLARARQNELVMRHHERARDLVADLAEAFAVERVLVSLASPRPDLDVEAFRTAGLASGSSLTAAASVYTQADAEVAVVGTLLRDVRREIARLVGATPESAVEPVEVGADWPVVPAPDQEALLFARGDLQQKLAAYEVADRRLRLAIVRQWPSLGLAFGGNVALGLPMSMIRVDLPLEAPAEARAMNRSREASRLALQQGVLDAEHEAASARLELMASNARLEGASARRDAAAALVRAAQARVETSAEQAFSDAVLAGLEEVRAAIEYRRVAVARARTRARAAHAAGWPSPRDVKELAQ